MITLPSTAPRALLLRFDRTAARSRLVVVVVVVVVKRHPSRAGISFVIQRGVPRQASRRVLEMLLPVESGLQLPGVNLRPYQVPEDSPPGTPVVELAQIGVAWSLTLEGDENGLSPGVGEG
jgi:hypothetical protein